MRISRSGDNAAPFLIQINASCEKGGEKMYTKMKVIYPI